MPVKETLDRKTKDLLKRLRDHWTGQGTKHRTGESLEQIELFELRYQIRLPPDLRGYFASIDGMEYGDTDADMFSFLRLKKIQRVPEELALFGGCPDYRHIVLTLPDSRSWFVIVDFMILSSVIAIQLNAAVDNTPVISISSGKDFRTVAPSFSAFLEVYMANWNELI
jgi:hypothetical protein